MHVSNTRLPYAGIPGIGRNEFNWSCYYVSLLCRSQPRVSFSAGMLQSTRFSSILNSSELRHLCPMYRSPKHFSNVPKMVSIFPKVEHEHKHKHLPLCALPSECTVK